jgi:hypothetical protein
MWAVAPALPPADAGLQTRSADTGASLTDTQRAYLTQAARVGSERGEVGVVVANARMYHDGLGVITGTFAYIDAPALHIAAANVTLWDDTSLRFPLLLASSADADELLSLTMDHGGFEPVEDALGPARLPMWQILRVVTRRFRVRVAYASRPDDFVRLIVKYKDWRGEDNACSDFRGTFSATRITIEERARESALSSSDAADAWSTVFDGYAPHNAVEFAYHAPVDVAAVE